MFAGWIRARDFVDFGATNSAQVQLCLKCDDVCDLWYWGHQEFPKIDDRKLKARDKQAEHCTANIQMHPNWKRWVEIRGQQARDGFKQQFYAKVVGDASIRYIPATQSP